MTPSQHSRRDNLLLVNGEPRSSQRWRPGRKRRRAKTTTSAAPAAKNFARTRPEETSQR
jgi:hypothetical protein